MGQQCDLDNRETIDEGDNADIWSHDSGGGCRNCAAVGFGALKNKMGVAFAPQDILSENSANNNYDGMKNIPVPGIELKEKMRQNAVATVYMTYLMLQRMRIIWISLKFMPCMIRAEMTVLTACQPMAGHSAFRIMVCMICMSG